MRKNKPERALRPRRRNRKRKPWIVELRGPGGTRGSRSFATEGAAARFQRAFNAAATTDERTIGEAVTAFLADKRLQGCQKATVTTYGHALARFFDGGDMALARVTEEWGRARYEQLRSELANDSHRNYLAQSKTFLRWCAGQGWLRDNPLEQIKGVGRRNKGKEQLPIGALLRWDQVANELAAGGDAGALAALFALWLGERASEIVRVEVDHVASVARPADLLQVPWGKTASSCRVLRVAAPLSDYVATLARARATGYLFASARSRTGHRDRGWPRKQVQRICRLADVPEVCAHAMRGAHATVGALAGETSLAIAANLGHNSPLVTEDHYAAAEFDERRGLLAVLKGGRAGAA